MIKARLLIILMVLPLMISCEKEKVKPFDHPSNKFIEKTKVVSGPVVDSHLPISDAGIEPDIIPPLFDGKDRGGNRSCKDVELFYGGIEFAMCGDRINYDEGSGDFESGFPGGLKVTVEGKLISFESDGCILIDGKNYKVGAVIVKGSNEANVYYYGPDGILEDSGLGAPNGLHMVSNLTFCFVECKDVPDFVIAFKAYSPEWNWVVSGGGPTWNNFIGYYDFVPGVSNDLVWFGESTVVGHITVGDFDADGLWEVKVDNSQMTSFLYWNAYLYVGPEQGFSWDYANYPYQETRVPGEAELIFDLPF